MPRFNFDLAGPRPVPDRQGMIFRDCFVAGRFAENLAADIGAVRPDICGRASVVMTDEHWNSIMYCEPSPVRGAALALNRTERAPASRAAFAPNRLGRSGPS
jgi:hypothetical protein